MENGTDRASFAEQIVEIAPLQRRGVRVSALSPVYIDPIVYGWGTRQDLFWVRKQLRLVDGKLRVWGGDGSTR